MSYEDLFDELNEHGITYVISRKYDQLPERTREKGGDVDILFGSDFEAGVDVCRDCGFDGTPEHRTSRVSLLKKATKNPSKAVKKVSQQPGKMIKSVASGDHPSNPRHRNIKLYRDGQILDVRDNLAYKSPMNRQRIPVHPDVTEGMLDRRRFHNGFYVPCPADELAHVITHCMYDKLGEFPEYYQQRCENLWEVVNEEEEQYKLFEELLQTIYFAADTLVLEAVQQQEYDTLFEDLKKFDDY